MAFFKILFALSLIFRIFSEEIDSSMWFRVMLRVPPCVTTPKTNSVYGEQEGIKMRFFRIKSPYFSEKFVAK